MKPINYKALGAKIKEYRKKENITQEQLAEMADISLSHMSNVETASVSVSLPALKLIADALGVTIDELLVDSYSKKQSSNHHGYHYTYRDYFNRILCMRG